MTLQAVLFDMDGLLVNSEPLWFEVEAGIMARMGSPWGQADQEHLIGGSLRRSTAYMRRKATVPVPEETIAEWLTQGMAAPGAPPRGPDAARRRRPAGRDRRGRGAVRPGHLGGAGDHGSGAGLHRGPLPGHRVRRRRESRASRIPSPTWRPRRGSGSPRRAAWRSRTHPPGSPPRTPRGAPSIAVPSVPPPPGLARLTVPSLEALDLAALRAVAAGHQPRAMTAES